ncbi:MAG TPA: hypothetical protein VKY71_08705, partial [Actinotalea caeni]|nr:hypothetical protein [Actinotalea caeni]
TDEAVSKTALVAASDEVHGLFDSSKVDGLALHAFATPEQVTSLITDACASDDMVARRPALAARELAAAVLG